MDYISSQYHRDSGQCLSILKQTEAFLGTIRHNKVRRGQLMLLKGGISWKFGNCEDALDTWTHVITKIPECITDAMLVSNTLRVAVTVHASSVIRLILWAA